MLGAITSILSIIIAVIAIIYSRKIAILQGTYSKPLLKLFYSKYDLFRFQKFYFIVPFKTKDLQISMPFDIGISNSGDKNATDVQLQINGSKSLLKSLKEDNFVKKGHFFHNHNSSTIDIGNKTSIAFYFEKVEPYKPIFFKLRFNLFNPESDFQVKSKLKDGTNVNLGVKMKFSLLLDIILTSNESKPQVAQLNLHIVDKNSSNYKDIYFNYSNNFILKFFQVMMLKIDLKLFKYKYKNFILYEVDNKPLNFNTKNKDLAYLEEENIKKYIGHERNEKIMSLWNI